MYKTKITFVQLRLRSIVKFIIKMTHLKCKSKICRFLVNVFWATTPLDIGIILPETV